jgi:lambda repressor-like predicted transcriptional regulator
MTKHPEHPQHPASCPATSTRPETDDRAARDHIRRLREHGASYRSIAQAAGIGTTTVHDIATQRWQPTPAAATAVLRVSPRSFRQLRVDVGGTRLRLRALHVMGHGSARLARAAGVSEKTIRALVNGDAKTVSIRLRDAVSAVYEQWWDKRPPERTRAERAAARAARRRAIAGNWCAAAALDDDKLDTPGYKPGYGWRPATGTGVAADIHPPRQAQMRRGA